MADQRFTVQTTKISGTPGAGWWSQVHVFTPDDADKKKKRGTLLATVSLKTELQGVEAIAFGREVLSRIHEEYFGNLESSVYDTLQQAIAKVTSETANIEMTAAVIIKDVIYLTTYGESKILLKRGNQFGLLVDPQKNQSSISGRLVDQDIYLLATAGFFQAVPFGTLKAAVDDGIDQAAEVLSPIVLGHQSSGSMAAVIVKVVKELPERPEEMVAVKSKIPIIKENSQPIFSSVNDSKPVFLRTRRLGIQKKKIFVALTLLILLITVVVGSVLGIRKIKTAQTQSRVRNIYQQASQDFARVKDLALTNTGESIDLANTVEKDIDIGLNMLPDNADLINLKRDLQEFRSTTESITYYKDLPVFIDINLTDNEVTADDLAVAGNFLGALADDSKKLIVFDVDKKSYQEIRTSNSDHLITSSTDKFYLFSGTQIEEAGIKDKQTTVVVESGQWSSLPSAAFYGGNLYLLDSEKNVIWRYPGIVGGFGLGKNWLVDQSDVSLGKSIAVDGSIWLLESQKIRKFNLGREDNFNITGLDQDFTRAVKIYTDFDIDELYVLDSGANRFYRISKDGQVRKIYQSPIFGDSVSMAVGNKKAYFLSGSKIYEVGLE